MKGDGRQTVPASEWTWDDFDHIALAAEEDPHSVMRRLGEGCPVGKSPAYGGVRTVTTMAGCKEAALDTKTFSSATPGAGFPVFTDQLPMISNDPPTHRDYRRPLQSLFTRQAAEAMREGIRELVTELIDQFIEDGSTDVAKSLCVPLPAMLVGDLLGLPTETRTKMSEWASRIVSEGDGSTAFGELTEFVSDLYEQRKPDPGDDIPSKVLAFEIDDRPITRAEWIEIVILLIGGGLDTTANGAAIMLHCLDRHPAVMQEIIGRPDVIASAIEELLRIVTPVPQHPRGVVDDTALEGQPLKAGEVVLLHWLTANRDPEVFPDPDEFKIGRFPNHHVAFGHGVHRCLGLFLAKVELQVLFQEVLRRLPDYRVGPGRVEWYPGLNRGLSGLGIEFTPGTKEGPSTDTTP